MFAGFQITCRSCSEKTFLVHFVLSSIMCQKAILVHLQIVKKGIFGQFEQLKWDQNRIFEQFINHVIIKSFKRFSGSKIRPNVVCLMNFYSSIGRFTKFGMSLTDNEPSQALLMPILTCVAHIITHGNHQQRCPEIKKHFALCLIIRDSL